MAGQHLLPLERIVATPGAIEAFREAGESIDGSPLLILPYLERHMSGDWGEVDGHDRRENELSVKRGYRILSAYTLPGGQRVWIITEADRSSTCLLLSRRNIDAAEPGAGPPGGATEGEGRAL